MHDLLSQHAEYEKIVSFFKEWAKDKIHSMIDLFATRAQIIEINPSPTEILAIEKIKTRISELTKISNNAELEGFVKTLKNITTTPTSFEAKSSVNQINSEPLITIIVPTYNRPLLLQSALESICAQEYKNWEAIVVNDAGEDIHDALQNLSHRERISIINHPSNKGLPAARNSALRVARGEIICYLDDDDIFKPKHLSAIVKELKNNPDTDFFYVEAEYVTEIINNKKRIELKRERKVFDQHQYWLLAANFIPVNCWAHKRHCLEKIGYFDETLKTHEDWEFLIRMSLHYSFKHIKATTAEVRQRDTADNMLRTIRVLDAYDLIYKRYPTQDIELNQLRRNILSNVAELDKNISRNDVFPAGWHESEYLKENPDVAKIVADHKLDSGYSHYLAYGQFENRPGAEKFQQATNFSRNTTSPNFIETKNLPKPSSEKNQPQTRHTYLKKLPDCAFTFKIKIFVSGKDENSLKSTLNSLSNQLRVPDEILTKKYTTTSQINEKEWILLLHAGDTLESDALARLELLLNTPAGKSAYAVYFDHDEKNTDNPLIISHFKPNFNYDLLLSYPYIGRALAVRSNWAQSILTSHSKQPFDINLSYRLALQAATEGSAKGLQHLPAKILHLNAALPTVFCNTTEEWNALSHTLNTHLENTEPGSQVLEGPTPGTFHVIYPLERTPLVSIIIPTRDQLPFLSRCIDSLLSTTNYPAFEILVVDNDSQTPEARTFLAGLVALDTDQIRVLSVPGPFNFSRMNNLAVAQARGEFILLLNNDTAALQADWLSHMVRHALRNGVGIVGARLLYPDGKVQHAGVIMGLRGPAEHPCLGLDNTEPGYLFRAQLTQNFSAVTAACLLVSKAVYEEVGGLDEDTFGVSYNDIDFCLRVGQTGRRIVWTPLATLLHEGSASQKAGIENKSREQKVQRFSQEQQAMYQRWPEVIANDPAYNPNLSLAESGYEFETNPLLCFDKFQGLVEHRIAAFAADNEGCGHYRVLQPLQAMLDAGLCTGGASPEIFSPNLALRSGADTLIFQRPNTEMMLANLQALMQLKDIKKIYEVDDHLMRVPVKSAHYHHMPRDLRGKMIKAIGLCDRLVVSTEPLARELGSYNDDVRVVHNRIPPAMWGATPPQRASGAPRQAGRKPKVGWAGGTSHQGDLEMIAGVIKDLADMVDWVFVGMCPNSVRPYIKEFHRGVPTLDYPQHLMTLTQDWDLAIAPVESSPFNDCKSNLKLLEYGWCGVPVVCSDVLPYQGDLPVTRVKNRHKNWRDAILERVNDLEASRQEGLALQQRVASDWMLTGDNLQNWYKAWTD